MTRMSRIQMAAALAIAALPGTASMPETVNGHRTPWRTKLRNTSTTVAAMKRAARKRRNVRARSCK